MKLERRKGSNDLYLVEDGKETKDGYCWQNAAFTGEYGEGNNEYVFEATGRFPYDFCLELVHADTEEDAEAYIQEKHGMQIERRYLYRNKRKPVLLHRA